MISFPGIKTLFDGTLGKYNGREVDLHVGDGTEPVFHRARPVPYALRARVDAELDAMLRRQPSSSQLTDPTGLLPW